MKVKCKYNEQNKLPDNIRNFAYIQIDENLLPLTKGKAYELYGIQISSLGRFYFVVPDENNLPWWMPAILFENVKLKPLNFWFRENGEGEYGNYTEWAYPAYFGNEEDIEDGTEKGYIAFKQMQEQAKNSKN